VLESAIADGDFEWLDSYTFELWCKSVGVEVEAVRGRVRKVRRVAA
jgi:hypothetical protein